MVISNITTLLDKRQRVRVLFLSQPYVLYFVRFKASHNINFNFFIQT